METAEIGCEKLGRIDYTVRNSKLHWWEEDHWACSIFSHYIGTANKDIWEYDLNMLWRIQITTYSEGMHCSWHSDYGKSRNRDFARDLSASLLVAAPLDYEGGDLEFVDYHDNAVKAPNGKDTIIVFNSRIPRGAAPVAMARMVSLVTWMNGPKLR